MTTAKPTRTKHFIPQAVKTEILDKLASGEMTVDQAAQQYHVARASIYRWANQAKAAPPSKEGSSLPPRPEVGAINEDVTLMLLLMGQRYGFDSPIFCELCRKEGVKAEDIKRLNDWCKATKSEISLDMPLRFTIDELAEQHKELKDQVATLSVIMQEIDNVKSGQDSALAKYAKEVLLKKWDSDSLDGDAQASGKSTQYLMDRKQIISLISYLTGKYKVLTMAQACMLADVSKSTYYSWLQLGEDGGVDRRFGHNPNRKPPSWALPQTTIEQVKSVICRPEYADMSIRQIYYSELAQHRKYCSLSTMHRIAAQMRSDGIYQHKRRRSRKKPQG